MVPESINYPEGEGDLNDQPDLSDAFNEPDEVPSELDALEDF